MQIPGWLKEGAKWGGGTIGGILVTLSIASYAERPRPSAEIAQISITNYDEDMTRENRKSIVPVPLADSLFSELAESAWTEEFRDPSDDLTKVVAKLNRNKQYVESYLRHAQSYIQLKKEMMLFLNGERSAKAAESFFDDWQQIDGFIYGSVRSQMRYGSAALQKIKCEQEAPVSHLRTLTYHKDPDAQYFARLMSEIIHALRPVSGSPDQSADVKQPPQILLLASPPSSEASSGDSEKADAGSANRVYDSANPVARDEHIYSVTKIGGRYKSRFDLRSNLDENEIVTPREEKCAENVMAALADFDKEKLNAILDLTDQEAKNIELHKKIQSEIDEYIKGYSFWKVSMLMVNQGKNPISFSPNATLYIDTSGTPINGGNNIVIDLKSIKNNGDDDSITIAGGGSRSVNFVSSEPVKKYEDWKNIIKIFEQSARNCSVALYPQTGDWQNNKLMFSPIRSFGPPAKAGPTDSQHASAHFTAPREHSTLKLFGVSLR